MTREAKFPSASSASSTTAANSPEVQKLCGENDKFTGENTTVNGAWSERE